MNLEMVALWTCVLVVLAGLVLVARDVCALNRSRRRQDAEMTRVWILVAQLAKEVAEVTAGRARAQAAIDRLIADLRKKDGDVPEGSRDVPHIETPEGADPS